VASAALIEDYWAGMTCSGPLTFDQADRTIGGGPCKRLFQNWLVKNPYYVVSYAGESAQSNWGAAATNAMAHIADYTRDREDVTLVGRRPPRIEGGRETALSPAAAFDYANRLALDRMNGYRVEHSSSRSCDVMQGGQQLGSRPPVKSQITELGILPEDARREQHCNIERYGSEYQNYPQLHIGNLIQQCELMLRRGDSSCYDNVDETDIPDYVFSDQDGVSHLTHLRPGRGSLERAINAVIIDAGMEWRRDDALAVAFAYYREHQRLGGVFQWPAHINNGTICSQDICFGLLTHSPGSVAPVGLYRSFLSSVDAAYSRQSAPQGRGLSPRRG
jgi:hypothetical protein